MACIKVRGQDRQFLPFDSPVGKTVEVLLRLGDSGGWSREFGTTILHWAPGHLGIELDADRRASDPDSVAEARKSFRAFCGAQVPTGRVYGMPVKHMRFCQPCSEAFLAAASGGCP